MAFQRSHGNAAVGALIRAGIARAKLRVGSPHDPDEDEADRVAAAFVRAKLIGEMPSSSCDWGETCDQCARKADPGIIKQSLASSTTTSDIELDARREALLRDLGPGRSLDSRVREPFESHLATDLSSVLIPNGPSANRPRPLSSETEKIEAGVESRQRSLVDDPSNFDNLAPSPPPDPPRLHAKLTVNQPGDEYEREANRVADEVMRMPQEQNAYISPFRGSTQSQRKCSECEEEEQKWPKDQRPSDSVAMMRMAEPNISVSHPAPTVSIQRKCAACEEEETVHRSEDRASSTPTEAPPIVHEVLRSPGAPLPAETRAFFEPRFGADFSGVRIHDGPRAAASAGEVNAKAYTVGESIAFGTGQFDPRSGAGKQLLAHELTHVVQAQNATSGSPLRRVAHGYEPPVELPPSNRELIDAALGSEDPSDVKSIPGPVLESSQVTDAERTKLIAILCNKQTKVPLIGTWIGPRDEAALYHLWNGFGDRILSLDWEVHGPLWKRSSEGGAEVSKLPAVQKKLGEFRARAVEIILTLLDTSEQAVLEEKTRYGLETKSSTPVNAGRATGAVPSTTRMRPGGIQSAGLFAAAGQLIPKLRRASSARMLLNQALSSMAPAMNLNPSERIEPTVPMFSPSDIVKFQQDYEDARRDYDASRIELEMRFPILASFAVPAEADSSITVVDLVKYNSMLGRLEKLSAGSEEDRAAALMREIQDRLDHINAIRWRLSGGKEQDLDHLWKLPKVMAITKGDQKAGPESMISALVDAKVEDVTTDEQFMDMLIGAVALALGLIAAIPTGGASLALAATVAAAGVGAAAASTAMAARSIDRYTFEAAAAGTAFDRAQALSAEDPSLAWLALDIAGAVVDISAALKVFRSAAAATRAVRTGEKSATALGEVVQSEARSALKSAGKTEQAAASEAASLAKRVEQGAIARQGERTASKEAAAVDEALHAAERVAESEGISLGKTADSMHDLKVTPRGKLAICSDPCMFLEEKFTGVLSRDAKLRQEAESLMSRAEEMIKAAEPEKTRLRDEIKRDYRDLVRRCEDRLTKTEQDRMAIDEALDLASGESKPYRGKGNLQYAKDYAHDVGAAAGREAAEGDKLTRVFDNPLGMSKNQRGVDSIFRQGEGEDAILWIIEYKGGEAKLKPGQMENDWVNRKIAEMIEKLGPDEPNAKMLRDALGSGRLRGRTYFTPIDLNGVAQKTIPLDSPPLFLLKKYFP